MKTIKSLASIILASSLAACNSTPIIGNNVHKVLPRVYRTAQLNNDNLEEFIKDNKIKNYINLRGENPDLSWYRRELNICEKRNVKHHDINFSARSLPEKNELLKFIDLIERLESSEENYAFHCNGGANRSGFAAAVVLILRGYSVERAKQKAFGIGFGHVEIGDYTKPIHILDIYKTHQGTMSLRAWVEKFYQANPLSVN